ncbi:TIGR04282 family arsenosugar biosynthesis glycosyltransferase [Leptobacterium sp. I13]|uniref:TIGR04282 family arsenosugar biosynthesis glycosyltransferase n=1 Tax=Leptobacterium meishanense TaxID=3128904 RepID=UPI0030EEF546
MKKALIIFVRNPKLGNVKTRLAKTIGDAYALQVYKILITHTVAVTSALDVAKFVYYADHVQNDDLWSPHTYYKKEQQGNDLGERMKNAFQELFDSGFDRVVIIGSDSYDITHQHIESAFDALNESDAVIGPAKDGGYYLLGLKKMVPEIFENKEWSSSSVLEKTLLDLKNHAVVLLEPLNDIDTYEDLLNYNIFEPYIKTLS